jgi:hypothetical protein
MVELLQRVRFWMYSDGAEKEFAEVKDTRFRVE